MIRVLVNRLSLLAVSVVALISSNIALAQSYSVDSDVGVSAEELFTACAFCHGPQAQGGPAVDAPPLAGMEAWYIERQLNAFKNRIRGSHPEDVPGLQMSIVSGMTRNEATVKNIAEYLSNLEPGAPAELYNGEPITNAQRNYIWQSKYAVLDHPEPADVAAGQQIYTSTCLACHGAEAQGNEGLGAPKLTSLPDWYMHRQLQYFRDGVRGGNAQDIYGVQMATMAKILADEQAIANVTAYVQSLGADNNE